MADYTPILLIVAAYFIFILGAILWIRLSKQGSIFPKLDEFLLAGRNLSTVVIVMTYLGTLYSTFTVIGVPSAVFANGIGAALFVNFKAMISVALLLFFGEQLRAYAAENKLLSPYECISHAYKTKWIGIVFTIIAVCFLLPYLSLQLVALGKVLEGMSGGEIGYVQGVGFVSFIIALYLVFGGMRAVAYTDLIQTISIFIGIILGAWLFVSHNWGGLGNMFNQANIQKPEILSFPGPSGFYTWPMFFSYALFFSFNMMQPHFLTRMMMAKNKKQIKQMAISVFFATPISLLPGIVFGIGGALLYKNLEESNQLMGVVLTDISSMGMFGLIAVGLVLIGTIGASMSTADSTLLGAGQIFTRDLVRPLKKVTHTQQILITRLLMIVLLCAAFVIGLNPPSVMIDLAVSSTAIVTIMLPTILFFKWKYRSSVAAFTSIFISLGILGFLMMSGIRPWGFHEGLISLITSFSVYVVTTMLKQKYDRKICG